MDSSSSDNFEELSKQFQLATEETQEENVDCFGNAARERWRAESWGRTAGEEEEKAI